jgi:hypothetical protein
MQMEWVESAETPTARTVKRIWIYRYSLCIASFVDACVYSISGFLLHLTDTHFVE